jgi:hypothetical protein
LEDSAKCANGEVIVGMDDERCKGAGYSSTQALLDHIKASGNSHHQGLYRWVCKNTDRHAHYIAAPKAPKHRSRPHKEHGAAYTAPFIVLAEAWRRCKCSKGACHSELTEGDRKQGEVKCVNCRGGHARAYIAQESYKFCSGQCECAGCYKKMPSAPVPRHRLGGGTE